MNLRLRAKQKTRLVRAASIRNTDLTDFVLQPALRGAERIQVSERDYARVLALLENPPALNAKLRAAALQEIGKL